jgi:SPP1 gp7 family putative phage head morphogenesis protein
LRSTKKGLIDVSRAFTGNDAIWAHSMKQDSWRPSRRREHEFFTDLMAMWQRLRTGLPLTLLNAPQWVEMYARQAARRMITGLLVDNARDWRAAALESMRGPEIYAALQRELKGPVGKRVRELVAENSLLIRTLPRDAALQVSKMAAKYAQAGERAAAFERFIPRVFQWQARRLARTEVAKANTALTEARAEQLGLDWFVWATADDERVRASHRNMNGVLVRWSDLPSPEALIGEKSYSHYAPGGTYNCRCFPSVVLRYDQLQFPHRIFLNNRIQYVTLAAFRRLAKFESQPLRRAA